MKQLHSFCSVLKDTTTFLLSCLCILYLNGVAAEETNIKKSNSIPPGFEFLNAPQTTVADFFYGDRYLTSLTITYTPETIIINNPAQLVSRIPNLAKSAVVQATLTGEVSANPAAVCIGRRTTNCGQLNPEVAGVIYDASRFRVDVFVAEPYLLTRTLNQSRFLPESESGLGLVQGLSYTASGTKDDTNNQNDYLLRGNTVAGWRENHLVSDWDQSKNQGFSVDTLYMERDVRGYEYGAGFLDSNDSLTSEFMQNSRVLGFKIGTSQASRLSSANVTATPLQIFINNRGRVEVLRDDRLIYASPIDAGSQQIDTSSFPTGSYLITVKVYSGTTLTQEFTRLFVKSVRLPPSDEPLWYFEAGEITRRISDQTLPERESTWQLKGGGSFRIAEKASLTLTGTSTKDERMAEADIYYQGDKWYTSATAAWGSNSAKGAALEANAILINSITINYYHRRLWHDNYQAPTGTTPALLGPSFESQTFSLTAPLLAGNLSLNHSYNKDSNNNTTKTDSISWFRNLGTYYDYDFSLQLDYAKSSDDDQMLASLTVRKSARSWDMGLTGEYGKDDTNGTKTTNNGYRFDARWRDNNFASGYLEAGMNYDDFKQERNLRGDISYDNSFFASELTLENLRPDTGSNSTSYTAQVDTTLAINEMGTSIGGSTLADSALLVSIEGSPDSIFNVQINGNTTGFARGGTSTVIPVSPFATYQVRIQPRGDSFFEYDQSEKTVTLYPGNVASLRFRSKEMIVLLGKLNDSAGKLLSNASMGEGGFKSKTNQYGIFQAQVSAKTNSLVITKEDGTTCSARLPETYHKRGGVGMVGSLTCR